MTTVDFRVATAADDPALRQLLRENPMQGEIGVSLEREPDVFLAASAEGERHDTIVARDGFEGRPIGMASRSVYSGFLNGRPARLGYLSQLRIDRRYRGRPGLLSRGYSLIRGLRDADDLPFDVSTIIADNTAARRVLGAGLPQLPIYRELEGLTTLVLPVWRRKRGAPACHIEAGTVDRIEDIARCLDRNRSRYQFAPRWTADDLLSPERSRGLVARDFLLALKGGRVVGCAALWDQSGFKQIVVRSYGPRLRRWRPYLDLASRCFGMPSLPDPGRPISHAYLSHVAVDDDDAEVFSALTAAAYNEAAARRSACLVAGFADRHPFLRVLRREYRAWSYASVLYAVCWERAEAALAMIDRRIPHLEVGLL
jgi:hypothetical protein